MREGSSFTCPSCGDTSFAPSSCPRCRVAMLDERGHGALRPVPVPAWIATTWQVLGSALLFVGFYVASLGSGYRSRLPVNWGMVGAGAVLCLLGLGALAMHVLRPRLRWRARDRRLWPLRLAASKGIPEGVRDDGTARVSMEGKVRLIEGVRCGKRGDFCAVWQNPDGTGAGGKFLVDDGVRAALVDDDCFEVWQVGDDGVGRLGGSVEEGATVRVAGPTRPCSAQFDREPPTASGRDVGIRFDGTPTDPLVFILGPR